MPANGKEYKLLIKIAGAIDKTFGASLSAAENEIKKSSIKIDDEFKRLDKGFNKIAGVGKKAFSAVVTSAELAAVAVGGILIAATKVGSEFETAFAGVKKTVDATNDEFDTLRENILEMSGYLPSSAKEIANVMEIAGQLGIKTDSLTDFTETMINLGVSTNMSAEDAATALAKFANITQMTDFDSQGLSNWDKLGSVVVDLGNNFATTEEDIVNMSLKLASMGRIVGLSESQIMGLATAMSSVGIKTEAGGSTMSKLLKKMNSAVNKQGIALSEYATVAGMTSGEFTELFRSDAAQAVLAFVKGLNDTDRNGKDAAMILEDMDIKEVRLTNTILALAGAYEVLGDSLSTADQAWNDSTALSEEAAKRYETVDSQIQILKNNLSLAGIAIYDEIRDPLVDTIHGMTNVVKNATEFVKGPDGISKWIRDIGTELPTIQRKIKKYGGALLDFLSPVIDAGKWFIRNPKAIISTIAGIGGALASYKIASTTSHIITNIKSFIAASNPVTLAIGGVTLAISGLVAGYTAYKLSEQEIIDNNLNKHFGDIALSMKDIQTIAEYIVSDEALGGVKKALDQFADLGTISGTINTNIAELEKMNWKVSIGMELTPEDQESYQATIKSYVESVEAYALQAQYAVSLSLEIGLPGNETVQSKVTAFYNDSYTELQSLGTDLKNVVNDAFNDGILDINEVNAITKIQQQMADIQKALALGEVEASMSLLQQKYGGANLTADSFENLQTELNNQTQSAIEALDESYKKNYAAIEAAYKNGGYFENENEYRSALDELKKNYASETAGVQIRALEFQLNTIAETYGTEIAEFDKAVQEAFAYFNPSDYEMQWKETPGAMWDWIINRIMENGPASTSKEAIEQLLENMASSISGAYSLSENIDNLNEDTKAELQTTIDMIEKLQGITARRGGLFNTISGNEQGLRKSALTILKNSGGFFGENLPEGMTIYENIVRLSEEESDSAASSVYNNLQESLTDVFTTGLEISPSLKVNIKSWSMGTNPFLFPYDVSFPFSKETVNPSSSNYPYSSIGGHADGGLVSKKELSWLAEKGPEMVVPLDGSRRAKSLWEQAGQLLGMGGRFDNLELDSGSSATIMYSPTLQFYGDAPSREDLDDALSMSQDKFDIMMEQYIKNRGRMAFN